MTPLDPGGIEGGGQGIGPGQASTGPDEQTAEHAGRRPVAMRCRGRRRIAPFLGRPPAGGGGALTLVHSPSHQLLCHPRVHSHATNLGLRVDNVKNISI